MSFVKNIQAWQGPVTTSKHSYDWSKKKTLYPNQYNVVNGQVFEVKTVVVHSFEVMEWEDAILSAGEYLYDWEQSEAGRWVMEHAVDQPIWHRMTVPVTMVDKFRVVAKLLAKDHTFWQLKWGNNLTNP